MELIRIGHAAFSVLIVHRRFKGSESIGFHEPMGCEVKEPSQLLLEW